MKFVIEKNIPIPEFVAKSEMTENMKAMEIGDSMVVSDKILNTLYIRAQRAGIKITVRKSEDGKFRFWRIE